MCTEVSVLQLGFSKEANLYLQAGGVHKNTVRSTAVTPIDENEYIREAEGQINKVVTTGGTSRLASRKEIASYIFNKQVRIGCPESCAGLVMKLIVDNFYKNNPDMLGQDDKIRKYIRDFGYSLVHSSYWGQNGVVQEKPNVLKEGCFLQQKHWSTLENMKLLNRLEAEGTGAVRIIFSMPSSREARPYG
uniref:Bm9467 n=1 Tax=Brugia malayi TaxID=6279 RepID=A0A1I9G6R5_BRUMA|nr:Bm9467 [Brugia malayi]